MPPARNGRNLRAYRRKAQRLRRSEDLCWICGEWIDRDLPPTHAQSWTADHMHPLAAGGHIMGELRAAHRDCNARRGSGKTKAAQTRAPQRTSRDW